MAASVDELTPERKNRISASRNDLLWAGTAVLALVVVIVLALSNWRGVQRANQRETDTRELLGNFRRILRFIDETETGQRGYLLTAEDTYLEPYKNAVQKLPLEMRALRSNIEGQRYQQQINDLRQLAADKLSELKQTVE